MAKILIVIPHDGFQDEELAAVLDVLKKNGHSVDVGSTHHTEARGHYGALITPNVNISFIEKDDYDCAVFIGGRGIEEYLDNSNILNMIQAFYSQHKLIAAIGMAVEILAVAGVISSRKVTCNTSILPIIQGAGAFYTGRIVEQDGWIITGVGPEAAGEFASQIASEMETKEKRSERKFSNA